MLSRRSLLSGLAASAACGKSPPGDAAPPPSSSTAPSAPAPAASSSSPAAPAPSAPPSASPSPLPSKPVVKKLDFDATPAGPEAAVVLSPSWGAPGERFPVLVALHGLGENRKGKEGGAWGWVRDYWLDKAMARLREPPLTRDDFQGFVDAARLEAINDSLRKQPFRGLVVACPFTPDLWTDRSLDRAGPFASFVTGTLLPRLEGEAPALSGRASTGIDGVSLGGRVALLVGFDRPAAFGAVGTLQAAIEMGEARELARRAKKADEQGPQRLRLLTSTRDFYKDEIRNLHRALDKQGVEHEHRVVPGPHDYPFNRGPGALEMLLWHDRVLRGEAPV